MSRNISGTKIAKELNITPTYFYEIERGKKRLSAEMAAKLAAIFDVTIDYLLGHDEQPVNNDNAEAAIPTGQHLNISVILAGTGRGCKASWCT